MTVRRFMIVSVSCADMPKSPASQSHGRREMFVNKGDIVVGVGVAVLLISRIIYSMTSILQ